MIKTQIKSNGNCKVRHWLLGAETANGTLVVGYHCNALQWYNQWKIGKNGQIPADGGGSGSPGRGTRGWELIFNPATRPTHLKPTNLMNESSLSYFFYPATRPTNLKQKMFENRPEDALGSLV